MVKQSVIVHIGGQRYVVRSTADKAYVQKLAAFVNEQLEQIQAASKQVTQPSLAILAALNIADELFKERQKRVELKKQIRNKSMAIMAFLDKEAISL